MLIAATMALIAAFVRWRDGSDAPTLVLRDSHRSLGVMTPGLTREIKYEVVNGGRGTLVIRDIRTSCGCSPASISSRVIGPGKAAEVTVRFRAPSDPGHFAHSIFLSTNDEAHPSTELTFEGRAMWPLEVQPASLHLTSTGEGSAVTANLDLFSTSGTPFEVRKVRASDPRIKVSELAAEESPHRKRYLVAVEATGVGALSGMIHFETSEPGRPTLVVPLQLERIDTDRVLPSRVMINPSKVGAVVRAKFVISLDGEESARISRVEASGGGWQVSKWEAVASRENRLICDVELRAPGTAGYSRSTLAFFSSGERIIGRSELSGLVTQ